MHNAQEKIFPDRIRDLMNNRIASIKPYIIITQAGIEEIWIHIGSLELDITSTVGNFSFLIITLAPG